MIKTFRRRLRGFHRALFCAAGDYGIAHRGDIFSKADDVDLIRASFFQPELAVYRII